MYIIYVHMYLQSMHCLLLLYPVERADPVVQQFIKTDNEFHGHAKVQQYYDILKLPVKLPCCHFSLKLLCCCRRQPVSGHLLRGNQPEGGGMSHVTRTTRGRRTAVVVVGGVDYLPTSWDFSRTIQQYHRICM